MELSQETPSIYKWKEISDFDLLYAAKVNQIRILQSRGFTIPEEQLALLEYVDFADFERLKARYLRRLLRRTDDPRAYLSELYKKEDEEGNVLESVYVAFVTERNEGQSIKKDTIDVVIATAELQGTSQIMLIAALNVHQDTLKLTKEAGQLFEIYSEQNMAVDRREHVMNPKIIVMSAEEKRDFFQETGLSAKMLARYEGWNREKAETAEPFLQHNRYPNGTLVKLIRENNYTPQSVITESFYCRIVQ